jgi:hypothetical protein
MSERDPMTDITAQFAALLDEVRAADAQLDREIAAQQAEVDSAREAQAEAARAGDLGPDWRTVQSRIDLGETTLEAVFTGTDTSSAAQALREMSRRNLEELREMWDEQDEDPDQAEPSPAAEVSAAAAESHERFEAARAEIARILARSGLGDDRSSGLGDDRKGGV